MSIKVNYNNMMQYTLGERGITDQQLQDHVEMALQAHAQVEAGRSKGMQEWMDCPYSPQELIDRINQTAQRIRDNCEYFVVFGIGGSALGAIAMFNALKHLYYNELPRSVRKGPRFYVIDNVDPERLNALLDIIDIEKTIFNVITKSGSTSETMSQYLIAMDLLTKKLGDKAHEHIIATTSRTTGNLIKLAEQNNFETFFIPDGVGGRFSGFSPVGLLPAAVVGIDIEQMLAGAKDMDERCKSTDINKNPALAGAVLQYISMQQGKNVSVMMPYADSLKYVADWYCQLWAESLGKRLDWQGNIVNVGQTPTKALGVTDQHSQVQLFIEGPRDKVITFIEVQNYRSSYTIPHGCEQFPNVNFLCGHTLDNLMNNELHATRYALTQRGRSNFTIVMDCVNEYNLGALLYLLQLQTAYTGAMLNINTFDQPGVEGGKNATYALFGRKGFEAKAAEMRSSKPDDDKYIV